MKTLVAIVLVAFFAVGLMGPQAAFADWDTENFDGGPGSTLNTTVETSSSVPDVGPSGPVGYYDEDMNYHSN